MLLHNLHCNQKQDSGQCARSNTTSGSDLARIPDLDDKKIVRVICAYAHTLFIGKDQSIYGCGYNGHNAMGNASTTVTQYVKKLTVPRNDKHKLTHLESGRYSSVFVYGMQQVACYNFVDSRYLVTNSAVSSDWKSVTAGYHEFDIASKFETARIVQVSIFDHLYAILCMSPRCV